jgi:ubiquinone/menaquinone biosynthesis C-methylase UbiE
MDAREMQVMLDVDDHHWWYRGRRAVIAAELEQLPPTARGRVLDAGCGSGRTLLELASYGEVSGVDLSEDAVALAQRRGPFDVRVGRLEQLPFDDAAFELVTCLDVLEHTANDVLALTELQRVTKDGGWLLVTVPAYQRLWSRHDEANHHYRRYERQTLNGSATSAGWLVHRETYFNSLLLPAAALVRFAQRTRRLNRDYSSDLRLAPDWLGGLLEMPLRAEARWLRAGHTLPAGLSLMAVLRKPAVVRTQAGPQTSPAVVAHPA